MVVKALPPIAPLAIQRGLASQDQGSRDVLAMQERIEVSHSSYTWQCCRQPLMTANKHGGGAYKPLCTIAARNIWSGGVGTSSPS
jgi:hypothetical protein